MNDYLGFRRIAAPCRRRPFHVLKTDQATGAGLQGAIFELEAPDGTVSRGTSNAQGLAVFTLAPCGGYTLREAVPPPGYLPCGTSHTVWINSFGQLFVDGICRKYFTVPNGAATFSPAPTIHPVPAGSMFVGGLGSPSCTVDVALPGGTGTSAHVTTEGAWIVSVPSDITLLAGDEIVAVQTCSGALPSIPAVAVVQPTPVFSFTANYYSESISPANLLGTAAGAGELGSYIDVDLTLFAPPGYQIPGARSGAQYISDTGENIVNVVYIPIAPSLMWAVEYYVSSVLPVNLIAQANMPAMPYGTILTLTPAQLNAYRPANYTEGVQMGGPVALTVDGQVVYVLYLPYVFSVSYHANGGQGDYTEAGVPFGFPYVVQEPEAIEISFPPMNFLAWNTAPDGSGETYYPGNTIILSSDLILYAMWII